MLDEEGLGCRVESKRPCDPRAPGGGRGVAAPRADGVSRGRTRAMGTCSLSSVGRHYAGHWLTPTSAISYPSGTNSTATTMPKKYRPTTTNKTQVITLRLSNILFLFSLRIIKNRCACHAELRIKTDFRIYKYTLFIFVSCK